MSKKKTKKQFQQKILLSCFAKLEKLKGVFEKLIKKIKFNGRDITVFLLSLLLAFSVWLIHNLSLSYSDVISTSILPDSLIDGYALQASAPVNVVARCRTSGFKLLQLKIFSHNRIKKIFLKPENLHHIKGQAFYISAEELSAYFKDIFGDDIALESFVFQKLEFRFPYENNKKVPIRALHSLSFKAQYTQVGELITSPDSVIIYGEPSHLQNIKEVNTAVIRYNNLVSTTHGIVKLDKIKGIRFSQDEVDYSINVTRYVEMKYEINLTAKGVPSNKNFTFSTPKVLFTMRCAFPVTENYKEKINVYIDYNDFAKSLNGRCVPRLAEVPQGIIYYRIEPEIIDCIETLKYYK